MERRGEEREEKICEKEWRGRRGKKREVRRGVRGEVKRGIRRKK
jgi:hypothetical protein